MSLTAASKIWAWEPACAWITDVLRERRGNDTFCTTALHPQPRCRCREQEMERGVVAILMPPSVLASPLSKQNALQKMHLKPGVNWLCCPSLFNRVQALILAEELQGGEITRVPYRGLGLTQMAVVFWSPLCSHKTIVINLNIVAASCPYLIFAG